MVKDIYPGAADGSPQSLTDLNGILYFNANDNVHGRELWRSDGTESGTYMIKDIQEVQDELEGTLLAVQPTVEKTALELAKKDPSLLTRYLTDYSVSHGELVVDRWRELGEFLLTKYNDGYVKNDKGRPEEVGYPEPWLQDILQLRSEQFKLERWGEDSLKTDLPY